jgi:hypothetical protein
VAKDVADQRSQLRRGESGQLEMLQVPAPVQLRQGRPQGMLGMKLVAAVGRQDHQALLASHADKIERSAQCASSTTSTNGRRRPSRSRK